MRRNRRRRSLFVLGRMTAVLIDRMRWLTRRRFHRIDSKRGWGGLTKEDLARHGITPGMGSLPHGGPPPVAIVMPHPWQQREEK